MYLSLFKVLFVAGLIITTNCAPRCKSIDDPQNGYVTCDSLFHLFCSPECHPGYRFATKPAVVYMCGPVTGQWFTYPVGHMLPWPDCIPDDRNTRDDISHELSQKREEITKNIITNQRGIPTSPYASMADPEDRFHHLFDYIEKAQKAYQSRHAIEKEAQALKNENHGNTNLPTGMQAQGISQAHHGDTNKYLAPTGMQAQSAHNYLAPTGMQAQSTHNYPAPTRMQAQSSVVPFQANRAQTSLNPFQTSPNSWTPQQVTGGQSSMFTPTPYTLTNAQTSVQHQQSSTENNWKQVGVNNAQGRSNGQNGANFQLTAKQKNPTMAGKVRKQVLSNVQHPGSFKHNYIQFNTHQPIPGKPFIPVVANPAQQPNNPRMLASKPFQPGIDTSTHQGQSLFRKPFVPVVVNPGQQQNNPKMSTSKPFQPGIDTSTHQGQSLFGKPFIPVVADPLPGQNGVKMSSIKQTYTGDVISPELKIPLYENTYLPVRASALPGKNIVQSRINPNQDHNQNTINQQSPPMQQTRNSVTQQHPTVTKSVAQNNYQVKDEPVTQQHFTMNKPVTQQHLTMDKLVTQQHLTMGKPVTQQHLTMDKPVTQQHLTMDNLVTQQHLTMGKPVTQQHLTMDKPVTQQHFTKEKSVTQQQTGNYVTQQSVQQPITDVIKTAQKGNTNVLKLLSNGLNKDLKNLDIRAHLRPYRDAHDSKQKNIKKGSNTSNIPINLLHASYKIPNTNISRTKTSDQSPKIVKSDTNKTTEADQDLANHIQPIVISGSSVLSSIASMFVKKNKFKVVNASPDSAVKNTDSLSKESKNDTNKDIADLEGDATSASSKAKDMFQNWLTKKTEGPTVVKKGPSGSTSNLLEAKHFKNNTSNAYSANTVKTQDASRIKLITDSNIQQKGLLNKQNYLKPTQNALRETLGNIPLTTMSGTASHVTKQNTPISDQKGLVKEHLFYFPVKKNTLIDIFRESEKRGRGYN